MSSSATSADGEAVLVLQNASVAYDGNEVLGSMNGVVHRGDSVALVGPNGAGKSTLIRAVLGLVPVAGGRIEVLGTSPQKARTRVAYVPQADGLDSEFPVSALDVVLMGRYRRIGWLRRPGRSDKAIAMEALAEMGLVDRAKARFGTLSGGQRQRVLMARAVAQQAELLLLDEPFNGLDSTTTAQVLDVLAAMRTDGVSVVMATHDLSIAHLARNEACLVNGHQFAFGPIDATLTDDLLKQTYGGHAVGLAGDSTIVTPSLTMLQRIFFDPFTISYMQRALMAVVVMSCMGVLCGLHVIFRRLAFLAETLQHTIFPGIVIAFLLDQSLLAGAAAAAMLTVAAFTLLLQRPRIDEDSVLAVMVSLFFGLGVVLVSRSDSFQHDLTTLLFGRLLSVSQHELYETLGVAVVVIGLLLVFHKELLLRAFDPDGARAMGYRVPMMDLLLNVLVAAVVVASVRAVATVLVIAFLVTPAATARLTATRVSTMYAVGLAIAVSCGWLGLGLSYELSINHDVQVASGAAVVVLLTIAFVISLTFTDLSRRLRSRRTS